MGPPPRLGVPPLPLPHAAILPALIPKGVDGFGTPSQLEALARQRCCRFQLCLTANHQCPDIEPHTPSPWSNTIHLLDGPTVWGGRGGEAHHIRGGGRGWGWGPGCGMKKGVRGLEHRLEHHRTAATAAIADLAALHETRTKERAGPAAEGDALQPI